MHDDPELETFLRKFRPRPPAPLPRSRPRAVPHWTLAAAAVLALATAVWHWAPEPGSDGGPLPLTSTRSTPIPLTALSVAMREGNHESILDQMSARALPDPVQAGGALRVLGDVTRDGSEPGSGRTR